MTEEEWLACQESRQMLAFLNGRISDRKARLFGCACVSRISDLLPDDRYRAALEVAERYADRLASDSELQTTHGTVHTGSWGTMTDATRALTAVLNKSGVASHVYHDAIRLSDRARS